MNPVLKVSAPENVKIQTAKSKWLKLMVEHEHIEDVLNGLETTQYELFQILDGQIWTHMILRKKEEAAPHGKRTASKVLPAQE